MFLLQQASKDAAGSKSVRVLNMAGLYMQGLQKLLNMSHYGLKCLNIPKYA